MFSLEAALFSSGTLLPLAVLAYSFVVGIVVSKVSDHNGGWHRLR